MAKDPAFLFYSADFLIGTAFFTNDQIGKYIKLLCYQHQIGRLTKEMILTITDSWDEVIMQKFIEKDGAFYNERLLEEMLRRDKFREHQKNNAKMRWHKLGNATAMPLETETETETEAVTDNKALKKIGGRNNSKHNHDQRFKDAFESFLEMRKKLRKPATDRAQELLIEKLDKVGLEVAIAMLNQSIMHSWIGIFPLKTPPDAVVKAQQESVIPKYETNPEEQEKVSKMIKETLGRMR